MLKRQYRCGGFEVSVVVDNGKLVCGGKRRGEQVGHADGSMLAGSCQGSLCAECGLPMLVVGRQILVGGAAVRPELFVFGRPAGTAERLGILRCCCGDHTAFDQRPQPARHLWVAHSGRGAGVDQITRD